MRDLVWLIATAYRSTFQRRRSRKSLSKSNPYLLCQPFYSRGNSRARIQRDLPRVYFPAVNAGGPPRVASFRFFLLAREKEGYQRISTEREREESGGKGERGKTILHPRVCTVVNIPTDAQPGHHRELHPRQVAHSLASECTSRPCSRDT